jgi:beta-N-acetylhexosaminidase
VKDSLGVVPIGALGRGARVLSITFARRADITAGGAFNAELRAAFPALRAEFIDADDAARSYDRLLQAADSADVAVVSSYVTHAWNATTVAAPRAFADFVAQLTARGRRLVVVAMGNPYLLQQVPMAPAYLVGWGGSPVSQRAAARALLGRAPITGRLPISIPPLAPIGAGLTRPFGAQ